MRHRGIKGPPLCCEIKKETIHAWSGGQKSWAWAGGGEQERETGACERREQGDNGWDGFQVTQRWGPGYMYGYWAGLVQVLRRR